jgi:hypothetical protein
MDAAPAPPRTPDGPPHGPDKPGLQWALAYPDTHTVHFDVEDDALDAMISRIDEQAGGLSFTLEGRLSSGLHKGSAFQADYSVGPDREFCVSSKGPAAP